MIAIPRPWDTIESTAPSASASIVARGIHSCAAHRSRVYEVQLSAESTSGSERGYLGNRMCCPTARPGAERIISG
jgi:hypothetical protein